MNENKHNIPIPELIDKESEELVYLSGDNLICETQCGSDRTITNIPILLKWLKQNTNFINQLLNETPGDKIHNTFKELGCKFAGKDFKIDTDNIKE